MNTFNELIIYINNCIENNNLDIIEIGNLHKKLPSKERNWANLCKLINYSGKPESFRKYINRHNSINSEERFDVADLPQILSDPEAYAAEYKEKTLIRDIYNSYRLSLRKDARVTSFKDSVVNAINNLKPLDINTNMQLQNNYMEVEAVLMLSDLHIGVNCSNFYNKYNYEVAKTRVAKLVADTMIYCKMANVTTLHVVNLGDLIHGLIHTTARINEEINVVDQIIKASELVSWMLAELTHMGINITYRSCTDNHARMVGNKVDNIEAENFSRIIDWYLESRLSGSNIKFINDNIDISIGRFTLANGKRIMFAHGHLENLNKCIDAFMGATKEFVDYVLLSHFHTTKEKSYNGSKLLVNGSIVGTEEYALSRRLFSPAEQKLLIFEKDNLLDININLQL